MTPLQQYNVLVLDLMCRLAATGQYKRLLRYGVRKDQIPRLKSITADDREAVANSGNGIVPEPKVDPEAIDQLLRNVARRHDGHLLELRLIRAGAGQRMMEDWFGMESHERCETGSDAKASESSSPRQPEGPGGFPTEETCKASRPGVEPFVEPRSDPLVGSGRVERRASGAAAGNDRAGSESERPTDGEARLRSQPGARLFADTRVLLGIKGVGTGRYPKPDPETEHRIWRAWHDAADEADEAARLLRVHDETGVPVRIIWDFLVATEIRGREPRRTAKRRSRNRTPSEEPDHG